MGKLPFAAALYRMQAGCRDLRPARALQPGFLFALMQNMMKNEFQLS